MRMSVDVERAHTADTLAAVVVKDERLLVGLDELLVEDVQHLQERGVARDILHLKGIKVTLSRGAILTPYFQCE